MLNRIIMMGRLTADPDFRHTQSNIAVTSFSIACERDYQSKNSEEKVTDFIDVVCWRNTAEFVCKYFAKGRMIVVDGSVQTRTYEDKEGRKRKAFEILANSVYFGDSKRDNAAPRSDSYEPPDADARYGGNGSDDFEIINVDDNLPF